MDRLESEGLKLVHVSEDHGVSGDLGGEGPIVVQARFLLQR